MHGRLAYCSQEMCTASQYEATTASVSILDKKYGIGNNMHDVAGAYADDMHCDFGCLAADSLCRLDIVSS